MDTTTPEPPTFAIAPPRERRPTGDRLYPDPTTGLGRAWADAWAELVAAGGDYLDGVELATRTAAPHGLKDSTMVTLFTRAATAGVLERTHKPAETTRGVRTRTFYRVPQAGE